MKKYFIYVLALLSIAYWGCDKPAPTELVAENSSSDAFNVEIITKEIDNEFYSNGFDTLGIIEDIRNIGSIISVSGIKLTINGKTEKIDVAQTILWDLSKPVYSPNHTLLGYNTITPGIIRFNSEMTRLTNYRVKFRENGVLIDTVLGKKYEMFNLSGRSFGDKFIFPYNSFITFLFTPIIGQETTFNISTPQEITGQVKLERPQDQKSFRAKLNWNAEYANNFEIIIGGVFTSTFRVVPLYKLKTMDDGNLIIPASLFENIPRNKFNKISVSFIRKYVGFNQTQNNKVFVSSQSIHTIILDLP